MKCHGGEGRKSASQANSKLMELETAKEILRSSTPAREGGNDTKEA